MAGPSILDAKQSLGYDGPSGSDTGTRDVDTPTASVGDYLFLAITNNDSGTFPLIDGWTQLNGDGGPTGGPTDREIGLWVYVRTVDGTEPSTWTDIACTNAVIVSMTLGDQADRFDSWATFIGMEQPPSYTGNTIYNYPDGDPVQFETWLHLYGTTWSPLDTDSVVVLGFAYFEGHIDPDNPSGDNDPDTAYPYFYVVGAAGLNWAASETDYNDAYPNCETNLLVARSTSWGPGGSIPPDAMGFTMRAEVDDITYTPQTGAAIDGSGAGVSIFPTFTGQTITSDPARSFSLRSRRVTAKALPHEIHSQMLGSPLLGGGGRKK